MTQYGGDQALDNKVNTVINVVSGAVGVLAPVVGNIICAFNNNQQQMLSWQESALLAMAGWLGTQIGLKCHVMGSNFDEKGDVVKPTKQALKLAQVF